MAKSDIEEKAPEKTGAVQKPRQFGGFIPYSAIVLWERLGIVFLVYTFFFMTLDREVLCHGDDFFDFSQGEESLEGVFKTSSVGSHIQVIVN